MKINFITKKNPAQLALITNKIFDFLKTNKQYVGITLKLIFRIKCHINNKEDIRNRVHNFLNYFTEIGKTTLIEMNMLDTYIEMMFEFYSQQDGDVNNNRGYLLEEIVSMLNLCPMCINEGNYVIHKEALVYEETTLLSEKDIDVIFEHCRDELLECKVGLKKFIEPLTSKHREKLEFMRTANNKINVSGKESTIYLVTANTNISPLKTILATLGYSDFSILDPQFIIENI